MGKKCISTEVLQCTGIAHKSKGVQRREVLNLNPVNAFIRTFKDGSTEIDCPYSNGQTCVGAVKKLQSMHEGRENYKLSELDNKCIYKHQ